MRAALCARRWTSCLEGRELRRARWPWQWRGDPAAARRAAVGLATETRHEPRPIALGVNIDHVATLRQARRARYPDPVHAALLAEQAGADSITLHLREDRRHIKDADVLALETLLQTHLNLEMAVTAEMLAIAWRLRPADCCLVPERRAEITTEGGLDVAGTPRRCVAAAPSWRRPASASPLFIDPDREQIEAARGSARR